MRTRKTSGAGFTLLELLVVIAIVAIVTAIVFPGYRQYLDGAEVRSSAQELFAQFQRAKIEAVKRSYPVAIIFNFGGNGSYQVFVDMDDDKVIDGGEPILTEVQMPKRAKLQGSTFPLVAGTKTGFTTRGVPSGGAGSIQIAKLDGSQIITLSTSIAGNIRLN